jgi:hypothetical protein
VFIASFLQKNSTNPLWFDTIASQSLTMSGLKATSDPAYAKATAVTAKQAILRMFCGGERRIRTFEGVCQRIYSPPPLATRESRQTYHFRTFRLLFFPFFATFLLPLKSLAHCISKGPFIFSSIFKNKITYFSL